MSEAGESEASHDYFVNHQRVGRYPWSLYHGPLQRDLLSFLEEVSDRRADAAVLVIGCGLMQELDSAPGGLRMTAIDLDSRAIEAVRSRRDGRIREARVVRADTELGEVGREFDAVYAKEVIEHIPDVAGYLAQIRQVLRPAGRLWLSTPNYGEPWLPLVEKTFLELVARWSGYTRRHLHVSKLSRGRLQSLLRAAGFSEVTVRPISKRLALVARGQA